tara:strand:+ start:683 stop:1555 length:873 start_codon:yes stop_codon:yes gene_type:complete
MANKFLHAIYDDDDKLLDAVKYLKKEGVYIEDVFTPFPVHGLDHVLNLQPTRLAITAFLYGCVGLSFGILMINYIMIEDWPQNIGGKPSFSLIENIPAFVPVIFELTVFFTAHLMVITFYLRSRLWPFKEAENPIPETTDDKFLIQIPVNDNESDLKEKVNKTDIFKISIVQNGSKKENLKIKTSSPNNVPIVFSVGFVFQSRKYSDGSSNLRIQFTYGRGRQYAKNTGLRIFRKHWISSKGEVSIKHPEHVKINTILQQLKQKIDNAKKSFDNEDSNFEDIYKLILNNS